MSEKNSKHFLKTTFGKVCLILIFYAVIFFAMIALINADLEAVVLIIAAILAVCGWKTLNMITPNIFLIMPIIGWVIFFLIKGALSLIIGMFVAPFVISKKNCVHN